MTIEQVYNFFIGKEQVPCPLTNRLVGIGYQQKAGGYVKRAQKEGLKVDYTKNSPSQYWHLMTFCSIRPEQEKFTKTIQCGELIFWMAEVSGSVPTDALEQLVDAIAENAIGYDGDRPAPSMTEGTGTKRFNVFVSMQLGTALNLTMPD